MKIINSILTLMATCLLWGSCQKLEDPVYNIPELEVPEIVELNIDYAYIEGKSSELLDTPYFVLSENEDFSDSLVYVAECTDSAECVYSRKCEKLNPNTKYYVVFCATDGLSVVRSDVMTFKTSGYIAIDDVLAYDYENDKMSSLDDETGVGVFLARYDENNHDTDNLQFITYSNYPVSYSNSWRLNPQIILDKDVDAKFYAYCPYTVYLNIDTYEIEVNSWDNINYMYGSSNVVNNDNPDAVIEMKSAMATVVFNFTKAKDITTPVIFKNFNLSNYFNSKYLKFQGKMNVFTGDIIAEVDYSDGLFIRKEMELDYEKPQQVRFYVIPTSFTDKSVILNIYNSDDVDWRVEIPGTEWERNKVYTYDIVFDEESLKISGIWVEDWEYVYGGEVSIK